MSAEWEVQEAIFAKLGNDLSVPVYDFVPQENTPNNYVTIGSDTLLPYNTDGNKGFEATLIIHSWDVSNGRKDLKLLQGEIYDSLDRAELVITGYNSVGIDFEFSDSTLDPDGATYHGVQRFRILIMEQ
tara:strand:+ start:2889 stop:3275 length:387 start_codon:yes stop_codon:yes gene_type:complete